jgi:hypothetical protein
MKYNLELLVGTVLICVSIIFLCNMSDPYEIEQEAVQVESFVQERLRDNFQDSLDLVNAHRFRSYMENLALGIVTKPKVDISPNPYAYGTIVYKLVSTCRDSTYTDYGNKEKILMFKCKRYKQLVKVRAFESSKYSVIRKDLDEINKKTCN